MSTASPPADEATMYAPKLTAVSWSAVPKRTQ
jgi:hypothetical protein